MRIFLTTLAIVIVTGIIVFSGIQFRSVDSNIVHSLENAKSVQWMGIQGGRRVHQDQEDFHQGKSYVAQFDYDLLISSWSTKEVFTAPATLTQDKEILLQGYSGYFFHSFNSEKKFKILADEHSMEMYGMGTWGQVMLGRDIHIFNLSGIIKVNTSSESTVTLLPGEKIIIRSQQDIQKQSTSESDLTLMLESDSNKLDEQTWNWFRNEVGEIYSYLNLEYLNWKEQSEITDVDPEFKPGNLLYFNERKVSLTHVEEIFERLQKVIKQSDTCSAGSCGEDKIIEEIRQLHEIEPEIGEEFVAIIQKYYQRHLIDKMYNNLYTQKDTFDYTMDELQDDKESLQETLTPLSIAYDHQLWIAPEEDNRKSIDKIISRSELETLEPRDMEDVWKFTGNHIDETEEASGYSLELIQKYLRLGERIRSNPESRTSDEEVVDGYIKILGALRDQIQEGYFTKQGILYVVKPEMVSDEDEDLDFDIIRDFQDLFDSLQEIFTLEAKKLLPIDKEVEVTKILARLRWFECIFSKNPEYLKAPRVCRGKMER